MRLDCLDFRTIHQIITATTIDEPFTFDRGAAAEGVGLRIDNRSYIDFVEDLGMT